MMIKYEAHCKLNTYERQTHFAHFSQGILAKARPAIKNPETGVNTLERPLPMDNAIIDVCLVTSTRSANGAIKGMVKAACPEPDTTIKFSRFWKINIPIAEKIGGKTPNTDAAPCKITCRMFPSVNTTTIALENPTIKAPVARSVIPLSQHLSEGIKPHPSDDGADDRCSGGITH